MAFPPDDPMIPAGIFDGLVELLDDGMPVAEIADRLGPLLDEWYDPVIPPALKAGVKKLYDRGLEPQEVADQIGQILTILDRQKDKRWRGGRNGSQTRSWFTDSDSPQTTDLAEKVHAEAARMRQLGMSLAAIARELHLSRHAAERLLNLGTPTPPRKRSGARL